MMKNITVLFFATLRDQAGIKSINLDMPVEATVASLRVLLCEQILSLRGIADHSLVSINHEYAFDESEIPAGAEVALFPPVSGG
jgi:molybdopterin converting factor subunit 1